MTGPCFVDANVFVYARDARVASKRARAEQWIAHLWQEHAGRTSVQVLSEYYAVATRKLTPRVPSGEVWEDVEELFSWRPQPVDEALLKRGQERFNIYCAVCHGADGYGNGPVNARALELSEGTWTAAASLHTDLVRGRPVGQLYNTINNGIRTMPAYGSQIPVADRWAIVGYVRALQRAGHAKDSVLTADEKSKLVEVAP